MGLNNFVVKEPRPLPIFVLADTSGSMSGEKIGELNLALREMPTAFNAVDDIRGKFQLSIITFGKNVEIAIPLTDTDKVTLSELSASGNTPMGAAFETALSLIEDRTVVSSRAYTPTIVLISDGIPTDCDEYIYETKKFYEWAPLKKLHTAERSSKCQRLALGIGDDADTEMLRAFINNPEIPIIKTKDSSGITKFFKWVTMSTVARMKSVNPNETNVTAPLFDIEDQEIII